MNFQELKQLRPDLAFIADWIAPGSQVLDIGCGDGVMLDYLQSARQCRGYGVEIADDKVLECTGRGVNVIQQDMEQGLRMFKDDSFDTVLCLSSLQMMKHVEVILRDIARVAAKRSSLFRILAIGHIVRPCSVAACQFRKACPINGMTHRTCVVQRYMTLPIWLKKWVCK